MPYSTTNEMLLQPNPYAGGRLVPPICMPLSQPGAGGSAPNGSAGPGGNSLILDDDVSLTAPSTGLNGTIQPCEPFPEGNIQPSSPGSDFTNTVPGMMPGSSGSNGPGQAPPSDNATGWRKSGNDWYYFDPANGTMVKGWKQVDGRWYYLDPQTGIMATGWVLVDGLWYYLEPQNGHMLIDWQQIDGEWYYLETTDGNGQMVTGWKLHRGKWYFLLEGGDMAHGGWLLIQEKWYCFQDEGQMEVSKILEFNEKKYYVGDDGAMVTSETRAQVIYEGVTYDVAEDGVCTAIRNYLKEKIEIWMDSVEAIGNWYVENVKTYLGGPSNDPRLRYNCPLIGNRKVGNDCSCMVSVCLVLAGIADYTEYISQSFNVDEKDYSTGLGNKLKNHGFVWNDYDENYTPQRGDISVQHESGAHHVEVVDRYDDSSGRCYIWSWGEVHNKLPTSRTNWRTRTSGYWRIEQ